MSKRSIFVLGAALVAALALCACSQSVSVMQTPPVFRPAIDTIDFGTVPLWREADTTYTLRLNRLDSITSVVMGDSDFTLLNAPLTIRKQDSTVTLNIRYQPQSIANHAGSLLLFAGKDTLATLSLTGSTSPFERHVGDSYVFVDDSGRLDSVWVSGLPLTFSTSDSEDVDLMFRSAVLITDGDWIVQLRSTRVLLNNSTQTLPVATADTTSQVTSVGGHSFTINRAGVGDSYNLLGRFTNDQFNWEFNGNYCAACGFFVSYSQSSSEQGYYMGNNRRFQFGESYHLLRFYLRR